jgi:tRNA threonylcarbamoyl adenosine modification protein (Sua5/YciO/YrdC/YwlC family)
MPAPLRLDIEPHATPSARKIARAVETLHGGGVAAYATDTIYALGCAIDSKAGAERIYRAKQMSEKQRLALICPDLASAAIFGHFSQTAYRLAKRIFPGPYTLVVPASREVPRLLLDKKRRQVGIRIPDHPVALALARELGRPLLTSSAIPPGESEALNDADEVLAHFGNHIDVLIDSGPTSSEVSTVLLIDEQDQVVVVREGLGPIDDIIETIAG